MTPDGCSDVLCVQINLRVPESDLVTNLANCETSAIGDTCVAQVPEQDLFFNNLEFIVETADAPACEYFSFHFYRYVRSDSGTYVPRTDPMGTVDCSINTRPGSSIHYPEPTECWGGAWTETEWFPNFRGPIMNAELGGSLELLVESSSSFALGNPFFNRFTANDLDVASRSVTQQHYLADTMQDYVANCEDEFGEPIASIVITIDEQNGANDDITGW